MNKKFLYLYITGGVLALGLLVYDVAKTSITASLLWDILPMLMFFYLAYKTYHEKKDQELM